MAMSYGYFGIIRTALAAATIVGHYLGSAALSCLDVLFLEPLRWLVYPDIKLELELRGLDTITPESLHLERDKPMKAFERRNLEHRQFYGTRAFMPDYMLA